MNTFMAHEAARKIADLPDDAYLNIKTVLRLFGDLGRSTWYQGIKDGIYPKQVIVGKRSARWIVGEIRMALNAFKAKRNFK